MGILGLIVDSFERETCFEYLIITYAMDSLMSCTRVRKATAFDSTMKVIKLNKPMIDTLIHS